MITIDGISGAWNYTIGPIRIWRGIESLTGINFGLEPVVVVAKHLPLTELGRIEFTRVLGFVLEEGGPGDPSMMIYSNQHRATVLQAAGALAAAKEGATVVIDGVNGKVFFEPDDETIAKYQELRKKGPPPEPPGMVEKLMKVATDFKSLDPNALKGNIFDFQQLAGVMDGVMAVWRKEPLSGGDRAEILKFAKGKPVEESIQKTMARYDKYLASRPKEDAAGDDKPEKKGRAAKAAEEAEAHAERGRRGRAAEGDVKDAPAKAAAAATGGGTEAASDAPSASAPAAGEAPKDSAAARKAARDAEIEAARKARRGEGKK